ncbi:hypothetical protein P3S67_014487 [Capsicum chacoense]
MMVLPFIKEVEIPFNSSLLTIIFSCVRFQMESKMGPFYSSKDSDIDITHLNSLPHGIMHARSDLELKPLWSTSHSKSKLFSLPLNLSIRSFPLLPKVIHFQYQAFEGWMTSSITKQTDTRTEKEEYMLRKWKGKSSQAEGEVKQRSS